MMNAEILRNLKKN